VLLWRLFSFCLSVSSRVNLSDNFFQCLWYWHLWIFYLSWVYVDNLYFPTESSSLARLSGVFALCSTHFNHCISFFCYMNYFL
jgi:hypothetical protein